MKKLIVSGLIVAVLIAPTLVVADAQQAGSSIPQRPSTTRILTNNITGIEVPMDVLEYVQFQYVGHAVTKAEKIIRGGAEIYRLRVDRDDLINDYRSIILLYDTNWKLMGEEKLVPPPAPSPPAPLVEEEQSEDVKPDTAETTELEPVPDRTVSTGDIEGEEDHEENSDTDERPPRRPRQRERSSQD